MSSPSRPSQIALFWFWLPLALSWLFMGLEGPILHGVISRLDEARVQLAAFGIVLALEIMIESPIIMLLATSTALASDGASYRVLRRFMVHCNVSLTVLAAAMAFTPLGDLVVRTWMGVPDAIADEVGPGLQIMTLWTALIGWRRFLQGILIREGRTRTVGIGTAVRLAASGSTALLLATVSGLTGVEVAAWALMAGVTAEALYAFLVARPVVRRLCETPAEPGHSVDYRQVLRFHLPLAATSVLSLLVQPLVSAGLARMPEPDLTLAAWPVMVGVLMAVRSGSFALPETIIAQLRQGTPAAPLRRFAITLVVGALLAMVVLVATPLLDLYMRVVLDLSEALWPVVTLGLAWGAVLPAVHTLQNALFTQQVQVLADGLWRH